MNEFISQDKVPPGPWKYKPWGRRSPSGHLFASDGLMVCGWHITACRDALTAAEAELEALRAKLKGIEG